MKKINITSLRDWMDALRNKSLLKEISREVDLRYELAIVGKKADGRFTPLFSSVKGQSMPVITAIASSRQMYAEMFGVSVAELAETFAEAQSFPRECETINSASAPVHEVVSTTVDLGKLPIPIHHEKDAGPYITAGVLISKDPETGQRNLSIHRLHVQGPEQLGILILPRHLQHFYRKAEALGKPLEIAIAIGLDPVLLLASQAIVPLGFDEYTIASALYEKPLQLVKGKTVDIEVPAQAEIVLEGHILPKIREVEGPFGEYPKYYGPASPKPVVKLTAITSRRDPIYHTIVPATMEHLLLGAIPREGGMLQAIRHAVPTAIGVHLTPGGTCRYHAVVSIDKINEGEAKNAMFAAFASSQEVKRVVVVDKDVDIFDPLDVEWAMATRMQAGKDVFIAKQACGNKLDPSTDDGVCDKMGIDATVPLKAELFRFERIRIPGERELRLEDYCKS
ncbi:MAG: UbiD family decarboxylase [Desulfovibrio sp.]|jgi:2,5-furandicarboxylate decarboxylase 1|nr:UbiD family decarboxylase [Desulfovibrio sp.]